MINHVFATPKTESADIGVVGMGVMGSRLARNLARRGHEVGIYNVTADLTESVVSQYSTEGTFIPAAELTDFIASLRRPRVVLIMVIAGPITDEVIQGVSQYLDAGDIIIDGGNSLYTDTIRREAELRDRGLLFVGAGVSGGAEGALHGPSIMPGCSEPAYQRVGPLLESISAIAPDGKPCCHRISSDGSGHYVKMVHNGIEYADMQLIAEAYSLLHGALNYSPARLSEVFAAWNETDLGSYLIEITSAVLAKVDPHTGGPLVDVITDQAGQKGTGRWTVQDALELGVPITGIAAATFARALSSSLPQRTAGQTLAPLTNAWAIDDEAAFIEDVRSALYLAKIVAYSQGFDQIAAAAAQYHWKIDRAVVAELWRAGCIIRAKFLDEIAASYRTRASAATDTSDPQQLPLLLAAPHFRTTVANYLPSLRRVVSQAALTGVPVPVFAASLAYYDGVRSNRLPAALIQGMRDYFGSHTYTRIDQVGTFHTRWAEDGSEERVK